MDPAFLQKLFADSRKMRKGSDTTAYEAFMGFYHAVRWRDPGVLALLGFHVVFALVCLLVRRHPNAHIAMFLLACGLCYSATHINALLAVHWRDCGFSQNYFDRHGVFMSSLFCAPLLLVVFVQMVRGDALLWAVRARARARVLSHSPLAPCPPTTPLRPAAALLAGSVLRPAGQGQARRAQAAPARQAQGRGGRGRRRQQRGAQGRGR